MSKSIEVTLEQYKLYKALCEVVDHLVEKFKKDPAMSANPEFLKFMIDKSPIGNEMRYQVYQMVLEYLREHITIINLN